MKKLDWPNFYKELSFKLLQYKNNKKELINILQDLKSNKLYTMQYAIDEENIDPFTFFSTFNKSQQTDDKRKKTLLFLKNAFKLDSDIPNDFNGIPTVFGTNAGFFYNKSVAKKEDINNLWLLFENVLKNNENLKNKEIENLFNKVLKIKSVNKKITLGLFWIKPSEFLSLDSTNIIFFKNNIKDNIFLKKIEDNFNYEKYKNIMKRISEYYPNKSFLDLSLDAYIYNKNNKIANKKDKKIDMNLKDKPQKGSENEDKLSPYEEEMISDIESILRSKKQIILYGPPGTGKTWITKEIVNKMMNSKNSNNYNDLIKENKVKFITFHQSYAYEEFIEGIKPNLDLDEENINYIIKDGIFKKICNNAIYDLVKLEKLEINSKYNNFEELYAELLQKIGNEEITELSTKTNLPLEIIEINNENIYLRHKNKDRKYIISKKRLSKLFFSLKDPKDDLNSIKNIYKWTRNIIGGCNATAYYSVLNYLLSLNSQEQDFSNVEYDTKKEIVNTYLSNPEKKITYEFDPNNCYFLIIDEINRGNISKILGELITLLENNKRLGEDEELVVELPYSKEKFTVPSNLYIIATMNTADRSIANLDIALRRRFGFYEMSPNYDFIKNKKIEEINLSKLLKEINNKIELLLDRDHLIGASFFAKITSIDDLKTIWFSEIIPLLQEYFYIDWDKLEFVIGKNFIIKEDLKEKYKDRNLFNEEELVIKKINKNIDNDNFISYIKDIILNKENENEE